MLLSLEILGWFIILAEIFGRKSALENFLDSLNDRINNFIISFYSFAYSTVFRHIVTIILITIMVYIFQKLSPEISVLIYQNINSDFYEYAHIDGKNFKASYVRMTAQFVALSSIIISLILYLMKKHPSSTLGSIGVLIALGSSIFSRL